jgi:hypothetical protein
MAIVKDLYIRELGGASLLSVAALGIVVCPVCDAEASDGDVFPAKGMGIATTPVKITGAYKGKVKEGRLVEIYFTCGKGHHFALSFQNAGERPETYRVKWNEVVNKA